MFDGYKNHYRQAIVRNQQTQQEETLKASFLTANKKYFDDAVRFARAGREDLLQENVRNYMDNRELLFKQGFVSPEAYVKMGEDLADNVELQKNLGVFDTVMPQGDEAVFNYLDNFERRTDMSIARRDKFSAAMAAEYNSYKARHAVKLAETRKQAGFVVDALNKGLEPQVDIAALETELKAAGDLDGLKKLQTAVGLSQDVKAFVRMSPDQMSSLLADSRDNIRSEYDLARFSTLKTTYDEAMRELRDDPLDFAISRGIVQDSGFDAGNPEALALRLENGRFVKEKYKLNYVPVITKAEGDAVGRMIETNGYQENSAYLGQVYQSLGDEAWQFLTRSAAKSGIRSGGLCLQKQSGNGFRHSSGGRNPEGTEGICSEKEDFDKAYYDLIGQDVFSMLRPEDQANIKNSVYAYAAKLNSDNGVVDNTVADDVLEKSVRDVLGEKVDIDRDGFWTGGFTTIAPQGVSADDFELWFSGLADERLKGAYTAAGYSVSAGTLKERGTLLWAGDRKYLARVDDWLLLNEDGTPFVLDYDGE